MFGIGCARRNLEHLTDGGIGRQQALMVNSILLAFIAKRILGKL